MTCHNGCALTVAHRLSAGLAKRFHRQTCVPVAIVGLPDIRLMSTMSTTLEIPGKSWKMCVQRKSRLPLAMNKPLACTVIRANGKGEIANYIFMGL